MRILSEFFLGVTTIGAHHVVGSVTGATTFCDLRRSSLAYNLSRYANGMVRGVCMQKGLAFGVKQIRNSSSGMILIWPSNTVGYLLIIVLSSDVLVMAMTTLTLVVGVTLVAKIGVG